MEALITQLLAWISDWWESILPFYIIKDYEHGILLRLGKVKKETMKRGWNWKIPFIDHVLTCHNTIQTFNTDAQSLTTKDDKSIIVACVIKYQIKDPVIFLIEVEGAVDAIGDITMGKIKDLIVSKTWDECKALKDVDIKNKIKSEAERWGIDVSMVTLTSLTHSRSLRLITDKK
jgi:regulator of protease activity HflC (stomatin/prohibitin superfamily)